VIVADLDERRGGQTAVADQFLAVGKRNQVVGPGVQDDRAGLHRPGGAVPPPGRADKDEPGVPAVDVHGDGPSPAGADDGLGPVLVELGLGDLHGLLEVLVRQLRVEDGVAVAGQVARLDAARDRPDETRNSGGSARASSWSARLRSA
jgi:hypothetical protein